MEDDSYDPDEELKNIWNIIFHHLPYPFYKFVLF
jgi:hypothetical protein